MNVLQVVNKVMVRLREPEATSIVQSPFVKVVAQFVESAHREVSDAHAWSEHRELIDYGVIAGERTFALDGTTKATRIQHVYNVTEYGPLAHQSREWIMQQRAIQDITSIPTYWAYSGVDESGRAQIELWGSPNAAYTLRFDTVNPQTNILSDSDGAVSIRIPWEPIMLRAQANALAERGDDGGTTFQLVMQEYNIALNDAIVRDKDNHTVYPDDAWAVK